VTAEPGGAVTTAGTGATAVTAGTGATAVTAGTGAGAVTAGTEAAAVNAFWRDLGLPGLVDVHTHFMPANVLAKVWAFFDAGRAAPGRQWPIAYRLPEEERIARLRAFGVRRFSALLYPHKPGMAAWLNSWAVGFAARTPDALHSATFFPEPEAGAYVAEAVGAGARLFKAHVQVGGYDPRDERLEPVWGTLAEAGVPVVVHCGSGPRPGPYTGPGPVSTVLARHPRLTMIIAHLGAPEYGDFLDLADRYPGVYLDTTMAFTGFMERLAPFPAALRPRLTAAADRILLGTDFPNIPHPYLHQLQVLERLGLGPDWLRAVCHGNAVRLLDL
jgi:Amidohydrolase